MSGDLAWSCLWCLIISYLCCLASVSSKEFEFTFEVPDSLEQCFYEDIDLNVEIELDFQVLYGGKYDIDFYVTGPGGSLIYETRKKQDGKHEFKTRDRGQYAFCFNNRFSTFAHKIVYFYLGLGEEETLTEEMALKSTALTQMESSCVTIHESLNVVSDYQTDYRLREYTGRAVAEFLSSRVHYWSIGECVVLVVLALCQVCLVRSFFRSKPDRRQPKF